MEDEPRIARWFWIRSALAVAGAFVFFAVITFGDKVP
jgi:hypothetical protein